ncbi:hypothetical protein, partial [uncultured Ruminococcus sp.]|uniref:hypothetical protein n=1 Tax=uncultured Ruminococcus sp. TaxID=165186 RepID=UPI002670A77B
MAISLEHKSITVDVNNRNAPNVVAIANVNDKAVRYLDVTLTASGNKLTFTGCTATATFAIDGYLISDSVACTINSAADVITVPLENFKSMSGFLAIEIKIANGETQVLNTPLALKVKVTPSLLDKSMINKDSVGTTAEICREVATARDGQNSLGARLNGIDSAVTNKAEKSTVSQLSARMQSAETSLTGKANATDVANALKAKEDNSNKVSSKTDITDSRVNYPSIEYLDAYYYKANELYSSEETDNLLGNKADKVDVDTSLANKANRINSSNIFDFDAWAKGLQNLTNPVYRGTLNNVDYNEKTISLTTTEKNGYTNGWTSPAPQSMRIAVKPNTKYLFSWLPSSTNCGAFVFLNGINTADARFELKKGFGSFTTAEDTTFISIRFDYYGTGFFEVSEIMITEKESIYLPNKVAEGVPEIANEVLAFKKTTQASLDSKYDGSNIELGTATLTPYSTQIDKIKSATCLYEK